MLAPACAGKYYDAVVIGTGATGGWVAKELTEAGLDVLVVEAGRALQPTDLGQPTQADGMGGTASATNERQPIQSRCGGYNAQTQHLFIDDVDHPYGTAPGKPFDWIRARQVGGRTVLWGRVAWRISDYDLKARSHDGFGEDWPLCYRDLAPYYDKVERFHGVTGSIENLPQLPDGCFLPPEKMTSAELHFKSAVEARWKDRRLIPSRAIPRIRHIEGFAVGFPSFMSNGSTLVAAANTGRMTLQPDTRARCILVDSASGRARGVACVDQNTRAEFEVSGRVIVVCASTIESTRLLLNSKTPLHPDGLGNSSGLLGKYLMDHVLTRVLGFANGFMGDEDEFGGEKAVYLPRFRNLRERHPGFLRGYGIFGGAQRRGLPSGAPNRSEAPLLLSAMGEQLAYERNSVTLSPDEVDAYGIPTVQISCSYGENEREMMKDAVEQIREMAEVAGFSIQSEATVQRTPGWSTHEMGTARMGTDRKRSVLNRHCQSWDVPNVIVPDGSCWVSSASQNPTLTMMAIAAYAADHLIAELKRRNL